MIAHTAPVSGVDVHGDLVATAGYDNRVLLWQLSSRQVVARGWHDHLANQCRFDPTGNLLVTASSDYSARIWSVPDLQLRAVLTGHDDDVEMAAFSPDGSSVATASRDGCARIFDRSGALRRVLQGHRSAVLSVEWSHCGSTIHTSGDDGSVRQWDAADGTQLQCYESDGTETDTIVLTPDGTLIAGNDEGQVVVAPGQSHGRAHQGHSAGVKRLAVSPGGTRLVSAGYDQTLTVWTLMDAAISQERTLAIPHSVWARTMAFADEHVMVFGTFGNSFAVLDIGTGEWQLDHVAPTHGLNAVSLTSAGLATVGDAGALELDGVLRHSTGSLCNFVIEWQDRVVVGGHSGELFDGMTGECLYRASAPLNCAVVIPGTEQLVIGTYTGHGLVLGRSADGFELVATIRLGEQAVKAVAASKDRLFAVDAAGGARSFDLPALSRVLDEPVGHDAIANDVCVLPDGTFASVGRDLFLRLWNDERLDCYRAPLQHSLKSLSADCSGAFIAVGAYDGSVAIFCTFPTGVSAKWTIEHIGNLRADGRHERGRVLRSLLRRFGLSL